MIRYLKLLLQYQMRSRPSKCHQKESGMTMIELLVGTIIAFIIMTPLMGMVIGLLNDESREGAKATTEQDIQSALDYISEDVSQALYIYTNTASTDPELNKQIDTLKSKNFLPTTGTPILVFWKRKIVEDAVPLATNLKPDQCNPKPYTTQKPKNCNDTYILSLVSYQLLPESDKNSIWCQPSGSTCPSRIVRYEISDGLKDSSGNYYTETDLGNNLKSYAKSSQDNLPFNSNFSLSKPLIDVTDTAQIGKAQSQVLVNYIEDFKLDDASTNNLAKINITANALRRLESNASTCINKSSPYCVQSSVQVRGLSGLGTSK